MDGGVAGKTMLSGFRTRDSVSPCYSTRLKTLAHATNKCTLPFAVRGQVSRRVYHAYSVFSNSSCIFATYFSPISMQHLTVGWYPAAKCPGC
jgi:hypothetical protein